MNDRARPPCSLVDQDLTKHRAVQTTSDAPRLNVNISTVEASSTLNVETRSEQSAVESRHKATCFVGRLDTSSTVDVDGQLVEIVPVVVTFHR